MISTQDFCPVFGRFRYRVDPELMELRESLARLRHDDREWRSIQQALARVLKTCRAEPAVAPVLAAIKRFGKGAPLERCDALAGLFDGESDRALIFVGRMVSAVVAGLDAHPLGQVPVAHGRRDMAPALILAQSGTARLTLAAIDGGALALAPAARTARFPAHESWLRVLAGSAEAEHIVRRDGADGRAMLHSALVSLGPGSVFHRYGPREALHMRRVDGAMVVLRLERALPHVGPLQEHSLPDGALVHRSAASPADSRAELVATLLGGMERHDAVPALVEIVRDDGAADTLRWQALRQVGMLDGEMGRALLAQIAEAGDDPLSSPARALRASSGREGGAWHA